MQQVLRIILTACIITFVFASCKSKKSAVETRYNAPEKKEYRELSERLNLDVGKQDNFALYQYIANWLGTSHKTGGCDKSGIDCSCFVRMVFEHIYQQKLPRTAAEMHKHVKSVNRNDLKEGDLVFFNIKTKKPSHVGIYLKQGWFAHVSTSKGVMINNLSEAYYEKYFSGGGRN
jgi:murein DD-endopeptidase / murein LD-carboxypeptidase